MKTQKIVERINANDYAGEQMTPLEFKLKSLESQVVSLHFSFVDEQKRSKKVIEE